MRNILKLILIPLVLISLLILPACKTISAFKETILSTIESREEVKETAISTETIKEEAISTETIVQSKTITYYQLQLEFTTDADWSSLTVLNPENIYTVKLENKIGNTLSYTVNPKYLWLYQGVETAEQSGKVGLIVDYLISSEAINAPIKFLLCKGTMNASYINIYYIDGNNKQLIQKVEHKDIVRSDLRNPKEFTLDLSVLKDVIPKQAEIKQKPAAAKKMILAFYYPWYVLDDWSNNTLKDKPKTLYESNNPNIISSHIDQAKSTGIDGFISSWDGPDSYTDNNLKLLLEIAKEKEFSVAIHFETLTGTGPLPEDEILQRLEYIIINYSNHPAYIKVNGKPLIVMYGSMSLPLETWKSIFEKLRKDGYDATFLGMSGGFGGYNIENLEVFDGIYEYGIFDLQDHLELFKSISRAVHYYQVFKDSSDSKIFAATAQPGFDERFIPGRGGNFKDRDEGAFYKKTFEAAVASDPDFIFINSWNEWWEYSYIEPSELYGNEYLNITSEYANLWKEEKVGN